MTKTVVAFDLDGTLAESKQPLTTDIAKLLVSLLAVARVAVISGGDWPQFEKQLIAQLPSGADFNRLYLLPTCGTKLYTFGDGTWNKLYSEDLTAEEKSKSTKALRAAVDQLGLAPLQTWGELIEDRGTQITYSALGQEAPLDAKSTWDPDFAKRKRIKKLLDQQLPDLSVHLGGATSVDITKPGIDKAYGMRKLQELLKIEMTEILFMGDALFDGGNDAPVRQTGIDSVQVANPSVTQSVIEAVIACLGESD